MFDINEIRSKFPFFKYNSNIVYLDSSATSLKPQVVLDKMNEYYTKYSVNVHRGVYKLGYIATEEYEKVRSKVAKFINCEENEVIFTSSTTDGLNKLAIMYSDFLDSGDEVLTTELEHHSSLLPWMNVCKRKNVKLSYINNYL